MLNAAGDAMEPLNPQDALARHHTHTLDCKRRLHYPYSMTAHIYGRGQMVIPSKARKEAGISTGDVVLVEPNGNGRILLIRLERPEPRKHTNARLIRRRGKHPVIRGAPSVGTEQIHRILRDEFP